MNCNNSQIKQIKWGFFMLILLSLFMNSCKTKEKTVPFLFYPILSEKTSEMDTTYHHYVYVQYDMNNSYISVKFMNLLSFYLDTVTYDLPVEQITLVNSLEGFEKTGKDFKLNRRDVEKNKVLSCTFYTDPEHTHQQAFPIKSLITAIPLDYVFINEILDGLPYRNSNIVWKKIENISSIKQ